MQFTQYKVAGSVFDCLARYTDIQPVGIGAFGLVCSGRDSLKNTTCAIKKISKPFLNPVLAKRTFRELSLLIQLKHPNILNISDVFLSESEDIYLVSDLLGTDLHKLLTSAKLEQEYIQYFLFQTLCGLKYMHEAGVIHRDLKPSNILLNEDCELKICDFGLARASETQMTGYVATRYYRAPEIMLTWQRYDYKVDLWSVGCRWLFTLLFQLGIFGEMLEGKVLFPGKDHVNQFSLITELLGTPSEDVMRSICSENTLKFVQSLPYREKVPLNVKFPNVDPMALDLLEKLLVFDPKSRLSAEEALRHPYLSAYHNQEPAIVPAEAFDWSFTEKELSAGEWKGLICEAIKNFHQK